jgi:hypothetical protein
MPAVAGDRGGTVIQHLATVAVYVEDQGEALRFWTEQAGKP